MRQMPRALKQSLIAETGFVRRVITNCARAFRDHGTLSGKPRGGIIWWSLATAE